MTNEIELTTSDKITLERLNEEYVEAFMSADVNWYEEHLADDFVCVESDGSVLNKAQFLNNTAKGPDVADYKLEKVHVRIYGGVGLVQATGIHSEGWVVGSKPLHRRLRTNGRGMESGFCTDYAELTMIYGAVATTRHADMQRYAPRRLA